jgi:hypothetical protein
MANVPAAQVAAVLDINTLQAFEQLLGRDALGAKEACPLVGRALLFFPERDLPKLYTLNPRPWTLNHGPWTLAPRLQPVTER